MLEKRERIRKEDFLTGFLQALQFVMKILFFYGTGTLLYGFWQGITGGYLTLFAVMVISGSMIFRLLLMIFAEKRKTNEASSLFAVLLEAGLLSVLSFRMDRKAGLAVLSACAAALVLYRALHGKMRKVFMILFGYAFYILGAYGSLQVLGKNAITFSDASALIAGMIFFGMDLMKGSEEKEEQPDMETEQKWERKDLFPLIISIGRDAFFMASIACLTPLCVQMISVEKEIHQTDGFRNLILCTVTALVFQIILFCMKEKHAGSKEKQRRLTCLSLSVTAIGASLFLMHASMMIGVVYLLGFLAVAAGVFLLEYSGHSSVRNRKITAFLLGYISILLVMIASFQVYDGVFVDYSVVLMAYFLSMAVVVMGEEICM